MSKEEVLKALQELKESYAPVTINITPEGKSNSGNRGKARKRLLETDEIRNVPDDEELDNDEA